MYNTNWFPKGRYGFIFVHRLCLGGVLSNTFLVINCPSGTDPTATTTTDTLNLTGTNVTITGNATTKTVNFAVSPPGISAVTSSNDSLSVSGADAVINVDHTNVWNIFQQLRESSHAAASSGEYWNDQSQHKLAFSISGSTSDECIKTWFENCFYTISSPKVCEGTDPSQMWWTL